MAEPRVTAAARIYKNLLDEGFPKDYALRVVADHFLLTNNIRMMLYRSIHSKKRVYEVFRRRVDPSRLAGKTIAIDFYNVVITLETALKGMGPLILGNDLFIRDIRGVHGRVHDISEYLRYFSMIKEFLSRHCVGLVGVFLEKQISKSGALASALRRVADDSYRIMVVRHVDKELIAYDVVASSDSIVHTKAERILDIPCHILQAGRERYEIIDLSMIL